MKFFRCFILFIFPVMASAQLHWKNVDSLYQPLPSSVQVFYSNDSIAGRPNHAFYFKVDLNDKNLQVTSLSTNGVRSTPSKFYESESKPLLVMNCTFFEFANNTNVSMVVKEGRQLAFAQNTIARKGKDTLTFAHPITGALGIDKNNHPDIAWVLSDSISRYPRASQKAIDPLIDSSSVLDIRRFVKRYGLKKWKMKTAVGGGPVLVQDGNIAISNNQELKFAGKAINDKHPRTAMGYTSDNHLIFMVIEGRFPGKSEGVTLVEEAAMLKGIGCVEALNLDGGGSSCMLINGKETIKPSDKEGQRRIPAVILVKSKQ